jgi:hypothetical protein
MSCRSFRTVVNSYTSIASHCTTIMALNRFIVLFAVTWPGGSRSGSGNASLASMAPQIQSHIHTAMPCVYDSVCAFVCCNMQIAIFCFAVKLDGRWSL